MDLDLNSLISPGAGRQSPVEARFVRELRREDILLLADRAPVQAKPLQRIRARHHSLARLIASGLKPGEAAAVSGYDPNRVAVLIADPSFKNLVAHYAEHIDAQYADLHERMSGLSIEALDEIRDRLENDPDSIETDLLLNIVSKLADRTGHGPSSTSTQVNLNVNLAERMEAARRRLAPARSESETVPSLELVPSSVSETDQRG